MALRARGVAQGHARCSHGVEHDAELVHHRAALLEVKAASVGEESGSHERVAGDGSHVLLEVAGPSLPTPALVRQAGQELGGARHACLHRRHLTLDGLRLTDQHCVLGLVPAGRSIGVSVGCTKDGRSCLCYPRDQHARTRMRAVPLPTHRAMLASSSAVSRVCCSYCSDSVSDCSCSSATSLRSGCTRSRISA